jgi:integrase
MASKPPFRFSKQRIEALPIPDAGRDEYRDTSTPGLVLRVTSNGSRSFNLVRRVNGSFARVTLGAFPDISVEQAQRRVRELQGGIVQGVDPREAKRSAREEPTLAVLFKHWMETHAKQHKRTWEADERQYNTYLKPWAGRKLSAIKKAEIHSLQLKIAEEKGRYIANKVLALLRAMYNRAGDIGFTKPNPTAGIKKFPEEKRDRFLHGDDLRVFFASLAEEPNADLRDFFTVCLFVGARKSNVLSMKWEEIDFRAGLWRIPDTKSGQPVVVPLVGPVLQLLAARRNTSNGSPWVFPSYGKTGHIVEPKSAWKRIIDRAGLKDVRPHDLRRSLGSWMAIGGTGLPVIGKMLGHSQPSTTAIYARLSVDPVREAAETATAAMIAAGKPIIETTSEKGDENA